MHAGSWPHERSTEADKEVSLNVAIVIATYGEESWEKLARERAVPSAMEQGAYDVLCAHHRTGPIALARNLLAAETEADWLCFLDADDELAPGYLDAMRRAYERERGDGPLLLTPAVQQIKKGRPGRAFFFPECEFTTGNWLIVGTLVERSLFEQVGGFGDHPHGLEDWTLWAKCVKAGARIVKVPDAIYKAYWNRDSAHHVLQRDREGYMQAYEMARVELWG